MVRKVYVYSLKSQSPVVGSVAHDGWSEKCTFTASSLSLQPGLHAGPANHDGHAAKNSVSPLDFLHCFCICPSAGSDLKMTKVDSMNENITWEDPGVAKPVVVVVVCVCVNVCLCGARAMVLLLF